MTAAQLSPLVEKIAEAFWDATPTHCEVTWKEATTLFKDDEAWQRSVAEHRKRALLAVHAEEMHSALRAALRVIEHALKALEIDSDDDEFVQFVRTLLTKLDAAS